MNSKVAFALLIVVAVSVSGCSTLRKFTKKNDNTVLPGQREEILTPDQYKVEDSSVSGGQQNSDPDRICNPDVDPNCEPAIDQESGAEG